MSQRSNHTCNHTYNHTYNHTCNQTKQHRIFHVHHKLLNRFCCNVSCCNVACCNVACCNVACCNVACCTVACCSVTINGPFRLSTTRHHHYLHTHQVSVMLTLSVNSADNISSVIAAIADLLKIAVPPSYEISRSPSPIPPDHLKTPWNSYATREWSGALSKIDLFTYS